MAQQPQPRGLPEGNESVHHTQTWTALQQPYCPSPKPRNLPVSLKGEWRDALRGTATWWPALRSTNDHMTDASYHTKPQARFKGYLPCIPLRGHSGSGKTTGEVQCPPEDTGGRVWPTKEHVGVYRNVPHLDCSVGYMTAFVKTHSTARKSEFNSM